MENNFQYLLTANHIKEWDQQTIAQDQIDAWILMERASTAVTEWIKEKYPHQTTKFDIFCGTGNNGGDGFAIARLLSQIGYKVACYWIGNMDSASPETKKNFDLVEQKIQLHSPDDFPIISNEAIIIDALLGIGTNRPLSGDLLNLVHFLNQQNQTIISIDIPSGWFADLVIPAKNAIRASYTLSFGIIKPSFVLPESEKFVGQLTVLDIGLSKSFIPTNPPHTFLTNTQGIQKILKPISNFAHKGSQGHAALIVGAAGMMGAAILASGGCLKAGAGKVSCYIPKSESLAIYLTYPEVLVKDAADKIDYTSHQAFGIGSGLGTAVNALKLLKEVLLQSKPLVLDADAINMLAMLDEVKLPPQTILTPHVKEAMRLTGFANDSVELLNNCKRFCANHHSYIILKGKYSRIICPDGTIYFNTTGNPGMASAGMGDVLTGIITALLANGYHPREACLLAVFWHGLAGDLAATKMGYPSLTATDIIQHLGEAYLKLEASH